MSAHKALSYLQSIPERIASTHMESSASHRVTCTLYSIDDDDFAPSRALLPDTVSIMIKDPPSELSHLDALLNLAKVSLGAGLLFMPYCFAQVGLLSGLLLIGMCLVLTALSLHFLAYAYRSLPDATDYHHLARDLLGARGQLVTAICVAVVLLAPCIVYLRIISDYVLVLLALLGVDLSGSAFWLQILLASAVLFPLSCVQSVQNLSLLNTLGFVGVVYVVLLVACDYLLSEGASVSEWLAPTLSVTTVFRALATFLFAFSSHLYMPLYLFAVKGASRRKDRSLIWTSCAVVGVIYTTVGGLGYARWGASTPADILGATGASALLRGGYVLGRVIFVLVCVLAFPTLVVPLRSELDWLEQTAFGTRQVGRRRVVVQTSVILVVTLVASLCARDTGRVFDLLGGLCGAPTALVLPALFFRQICWLNGVEMSAFERAMSVVCILVGLCIMVGSITL